MQSDRAYSINFLKKYLAQSDYVYPTLHTTV